MDFFDVLTFFGGLVLFLYGMDAMGKGLEKLSGGKLEKLLEKMTKNKFMAVTLGACVTGIIQSSSATTVMVVGFVNSGIMKLSQAVGVIMGANIGTTVTSWILSLTGIESENFWLKLLKPSSFAPVFAVIGIIFLMFSKKEKKKDIGGILVGFAILMIGMDTMSNTVKPLAQVESFTNILTMFSNPIFGMLAGAIITAVIQSSSASVGILQSLCVTGSVRYSTALPIIMGQNIGTCITAILSSVGTSKNAKRAAAIHLYFNLIGTTIFMIVFYAVNSFIDFGFLGDQANAAGIAVIHSVFNITATVCLLPFSKALEKLAMFTIKDNKEEKIEVQDEFKILDIRFLEMPSYAIEQCKTLAIKMFELSKEALTMSIDLVKNYDELKAHEVIELENRVDKYEDEIGTYLVKISGKNLSNKDSHMLSTVLHCINDFERISDHSVNIMQMAKKKNNKNIHFSDRAKEELDVLIRAVEDIIDTAQVTFITDDIDMAKKIEPLEEVVDYLTKQLKKRHVRRLKKGKCSLESGVMLSDLLTDFERVADHCSNVAVCLIQIEEDAYETHEYLDTIKSKENPLFKTAYLEAKSRYVLPEKEKEPSKNISKEENKEMEQKETITDEIKTNKEIEQKEIKNNEIKTNKENEQKEIKNNEIKTNKENEQKETITNE